MLYIASDHGGYSMKNEIIERLPIECTDLGCYSTDKFDYPNIANILCERITANDIGITIAANSHKHIRCALCQHNNSNVLAL